MDEDKLSSRNEELVKEILQTQNSFSVDGIEIKSEEVELNFDNSTSDSEDLDTVTKIAYVDCGVLKAEEKDLSEFYSDILQCERDCEICQKFMKMLGKHVRATHGPRQHIQDPLLIDPLNIGPDTSCPEQSSSSSIQIKLDVDNDIVKMEWSEEESKLKCASDPESEIQSHPDYSAPSFLTPKVHSQDSIKNHASSDSMKTNNKSLDHLVKWKCHECGECFQRAIDLKSHVLVHNGVKPFKCDVCDEGFSRNFNLTRHMRIHAGMIEEKPVQCDVCMLSFTRSEKLRRHKMLHTGEKSYKCEDCEKSFRRLNALTTHKRIHTGHYKCDECEKCFSMSSHLIEHMNTHTRDRLYTCDQCEKNFTASRHLTAHMKIYGHKKLTKTK